MVEVGYRYRFFGLDAEVASKVSHYYLQLLLLFAIIIIFIHP